MIRSYFNATADEVKKKTSTDGYGGPEFKTIAEDVSCRMVEENQLIRNNEGNEVVSSIEVWLSPEIEKLPPGSEIVFDGQPETVIKSGYVVGLFENKYLRVFLQ